MTSESNYSLLDRMLHRLAFAGSAVQLTAADIESSLYGGRYRHITVQKPVFVTSLPRAGTTLMLDMLTSVAPLATHCYRDMPFVLAPILWESLSRGFRKPAALQERAHGDGMLVGYDSPEAFEEILWRTHWPEKYKQDGIELWGDGEENAPFRAFFVEHIKKIIALRSEKNPQIRRYISKNNANVARIGLIRRLFPDAFILIPVRDPFTHAGSLLRQHTRFLARHKQDPFSRRYMRDIGHLEFGELHRPIRFEGVHEVSARYRPETLDYWVAYWIAAFKHVLRRRQDVLFVGYERLCAKGADALSAVVRRLAFDASELSETDASQFHEPRDYSGQTEGIDPSLRDEAAVLHHQLLELSIV